MSFALLRKYSRKLYELNDRAVLKVELYRRKMDSQVGGAMMLRVRDEAKQRPVRSGHG